MPEPWVADSLPIADWSTWINDYVHLIETIVLPNIGGARLILDMHQSPGGTKNHRSVIFKSKPSKTKFFECWKTLAERFSNEPRVLGYGVLNEPLGRHSDIRRLMIDCWQMLKAINPGKVICLTSLGGLPKHMAKMAKPSPYYVWYECHMYYPGNFTHQGVYNFKIGAKYPTAMLTKKSLLRSLKAAIKLKQKGYQVFIGEFSVSSFADETSRVNYLKDCIDIFKEMDWPWCYHAWREAPVWNAEGYPGVFNTITSGF